MSSCRNYQSTRPVWHRALILVGVLVSACTHVSPLKATIDSPPTVAQVPLMVGVYYSPEFRTYEHVRARQLHRWVVPLGQANVTLFDRIFPMIFERVVPVQSLPPLTADDLHPAAVIEPRIEEFDFDFPWFLGDYTAEITYRFTLYSPDGTPVASWTVKGEGTSDVGPSLVETHATPIGGATDLAMQDAAKKFMAGFRDVPEVRRWLRRVGVSDPK